MSEAAKLLEQMGGVELKKERAPFCHKKVERLAARAGIEKPRVFVIPESAPNACAVALSSDDAAIAVTAGLLTNLDEHEIEAVLAHEIGHIQRGHSFEKTKVAMKALAVSLVAEAGGRTIATSGIDVTPDDDDADDWASVMVRVGAGALVAAAGQATASSMLTDTSFRAEFEADESGSALSRKPWALAAALKKIETLTQVGEKQYAPEVSQLFIVSPAYLHHQTHPPTPERVNKLQALAAQAPPQASVPTIYCSACGEKTDADGRHCYWCGTPLES